MNHYGQYIITDNSLVEFVADELATAYRDLAKAEAEFKRLKAETEELEKDLDLIARGSGVSDEKINYAKETWRNSQYSAITSLFVKQAPETVKLMKAHADTTPPYNSDNTPIPGGSR